MPKRRFSGGEMPGLLELELSRTDVVFDEASVSEVIRGKLALAGLGLIGILYPGEQVGEAQKFLPYKIADTPQTRVLDIIYRCENEGMTVQGCVKNEINAIIDDTFDAVWGRFYNQLQEDNQHGRD